MLQEKIREEITESILESLKSGLSPWRMPWLVHASQNVVSHKRYRGINTMLLNIHRNKFRFSSPIYGTFKQWKDMGFHVKKRPNDVKEGQWGCQIVFYNLLQKTQILANGEEKEYTIPLMRQYTVFNADQVDGDKGKLPQFNEPEVVQVCEKAEKIISEQNADIRIGGDYAAYNSEEDFISMPKRELFNSTNSFYGTMFHELIHWTGHKSRLNRISKLSRFGNETYAAEELVAEIGGCFLLAESELPVLSQLENHVSYIQNWMKILKHDKKFIFQAASSATQAVDLLIKNAKMKVEEATE